MTEILNESKDAFKERLKNPVLGAFTAFFIYWNWRVVLHLFFGNANVSDRIDNIECYFNNAVWYNTRLASFVWPVLFAAIFVAVMPYVSYFFERFRIHAESLAKKRKYEAENLFLEELEKNEDLKTKAELRSLISSKHNEIDGLTGKLETSLRRLENIREADRELEERLLAEIDKVQKRDDQIKRLQDRVG